MFFMKFNNESINKTKIGKSLLNEVGKRLQKISE